MGDDGDATRHPRCPCHRGHQPARRLAPQLSASRCEKPKTRAFERRDRVSEVEKLYITAHYYSSITGELDKARETGDPSWHTRADEAARRALAADPAGFAAMDTLGTLSLTRHRFDEALDWAARSLAVAPSRVAPVGIRADALIELGRYDAAADELRTAEKLEAEMRGLPELSNPSATSSLKRPELLVMPDPRRAARVRAAAVRAATTTRGVRADA